MSNLNLIIGDNRELVDFYISNIIDKIGYGIDNKIEYDLGVNTIGDIIDEASMISLFSSGKIIIGNNLNISNISLDDMDSLERYIKGMNKDVYIILIANKIDMRVKSYKVFKDNFNIIDISKLNNDNNYQKYISDYIKNNGYKINDSDLFYLVGKLGNDINNIRIELDKLFIYNEDNKIIDRKVIDLLISDNIDNVIYEFTNAFLDKDYDKVSKMYNDFKIMNIGYDYLLTSLSNCLRQILIIKILNNKGNSNLEISKVIGKKEFYVKKMLERIYKYTEDDICLMIDKLAKIDRDFKMGKSNIDMLEMFLIGNYE